MELIWDRKNAPVQFSDSSVFRSGSTCIKLYPEIDESLLREYHKIQNSYSGKEHIINIQGRYKGRAFNRIRVRVLNLGMDVGSFHCIYLGKPVTYSKVPYINGDSPYSVDSYGAWTSFSTNIGIQIWHILNRDFTLESEFGFLHMFKGNVISSLDSINIKVIGISETETIDLLITDLAAVIPLFVSIFQERSNALVK